MNKQDAPASRILAGDRWYTDSQWRAQLRTPGRRRVIENRWRIYEALLEEWQAAAGIQEAIWTLDAGCGDGINLAGLLRIAAARGWRMRVVGTDYNPLRVARAAVHASPVALQQASLYAMPYVAGSFDVILCSHVLEHVPELPRALAELRRVLRPNGLLIVAVPNEGCAMARLRNRVLQRHIGRTTDHVHFFTDATLRSCLTESGFQLTRLERETFFFPVSYLNSLCTELPLGHVLMDGLRRCFPSQAGGLITAAVKWPRSAAAHRRVQATTRGGDIV